MDKLLSAATSANQLFIRLRNLEEELGVELVIRGQRFEGFTEEGERVLSWAKTLLAAHSGLYAEVASHGELIGSLRLGLVPLSSFNPIKYFQGLFSTFSELNFSLSSLSSDKVVEGLANNQLDLGVCYLDHVNPKYFDFIDIGETHVGLLYDTRRFQFEDSEMSWEDAADLPLGMIINGMQYRKSIDQSFHSRGLNPKAVFESDSTYELFQAVQSGFCCSIMPIDSEIKNTFQHLAFLNLPDSSVLTPLGLVMRKTEPRSPIATKCFAEAKKLYRSIT